MERKDIFFEIADLLNSLGRGWIDKTELKYRLGEFLDDMQADNKLDNLDVGTIQGLTDALVEHIQNY